MASTRRVLADLLAWLEAHYAPGYCDCQDERHYMPECRGWQDAIEAVQDQVHAILEEVR